MVIIIKTQCITNRLLLLQYTSYLHLAQNCYRWWAKTKSQLRELAEHVTLWRGSLNTVEGTYSDNIAVGYVTVKMAGNKSLLDIDILFIMHKLLKEMCIA